MMTREQATEAILAAKQKKSLTFEAIARAVGRHKVWVTSALFGQATMSAEEAAKAVEVLGLGQEVAQALQQIPMRGSLDTDVGAVAEAGLGSRQAWKGQAGAPV